MSHRYSRNSKVHYRPVPLRFGISEMLFCSGRLVSYAAVTTGLDDVTCGSCRRKLIKQAKTAAAAA